MLAPVVLLAAWANGVLACGGSPDDAVEVLDRLGALGPVLPPRDDPAAAESLAVLLARWRTAGVRGVRLLLPAPGDPAALRPPATAAAVLSAGGGVITVGAVGAVLVRSAGDAGDAGDARAVGGPRRGWRSLPAESAAPPIPGAVREAEKEVAVAMREATATLAALDLPASAQGWAAAERRRQDAVAPLPECYSGPALALLERTDRLRAVLAAATGDGGAVTRGASAARADSLRALDGVLRRAQCAAVDSVLAGPG